MTVNHGLNDVSPQPRRSLRGVTVGLETDFMYCTVFFTLEEMLSNPENDLINVAFDRVRWAKPANRVGDSSGHEDERG